MILPPFIEIMELLRNGQILLCIVLAFIMLTYELIKRKIPKIYIYPLFLFDSILTCASVYVFLSFFSKQFMASAFILSGVVLLAGFIGFIYAIMKKKKNPYLLLSWSILLFIELAGLFYVPMSIYSLSLLRLAGVMIASYGYYAYFKSEERDVRQLLILTIIYALVYLLMLYL